MTKIAKTTCRVAGPRVGTMIRKGQPYEDDDPIVRSHPDLFASPEEYTKSEARPQSTEELGHRSMSARHIESARQAPGERRDLQHVCEECGETAKTRAGLKAHQRSHRG